MESKLLRTTLFFFIALIAWTASVYAEIVLDATSANYTATTTTTTSHTITSSGSNVILIVATAIEGQAGNTNATVTGVTWNGSAMTKIDSQQYESNLNEAALWYILNPARGTHDIVATGSVTGGSGVVKVLHVAGMSFTGVKQAAPNIKNKATGSGLSSAVSITPAVDNSWVIDCATNSLSTNNQTCGGQQIERIEGAASEMRINTSTRLVGDAWTAVMSWSFIETRAWGNVAAVLEPTSDFSQDVSCKGAWLLGRHGDNSF